jgi:hypothetical protein
MNANNQSQRREDRMKKLLQQALPPIGAEAEPDHDLWPSMLRRMDASPSLPSRSKWVWLDCVLLASLVGLAAVFPAAIPVFLYYL